MKTTLINNNKTEYSIVIPATNSPVEMTAATELKEYIKKAFDVELCIKSEDGKIHKAFYVGHTNYASFAQVKGNAKENWIIKMHDDNLILTGGIKNTDRGILYAVYHFLEDVVGIRWWNYWEEYIPQNEILVLDSDYEKSGTPAFPYRRILHCVTTTDFYYDVRTRCNVISGDDNLDGGVFQNDIASLGGAIYMGKPHHVHTLDKYFPCDEYFQKHPEWFGWSAVEGKRVKYANYCLTNKDFYNTVLERLMANVKSDIEKAQEAGIDIPDFWSVTFPDTPETYCQCEKCMALREKSGASGYALNFINALARDVAKQYPDAKIETLLYQDYIEPPKDDTLPEKNVILRLAECYADIIHGINSKGNVTYLTLLKSWSEICKKSGCGFYIWEYGFSYFFDLPSPVAYRWSDTFKALHKYGITGIFVENERNMADMNDLNQFMLVHLAEAPYADEEMLIQDFVFKYYGDAGQYVLNYLHDMKRSSIEHPVPAYCCIDNTHFNYIDPRLILCGMENLAKAKDAVCTDPVLTHRVEWLQKHLDVATLIRYNDLKKMADREGIDFNPDRKMLIQRVTDFLNKVKESNKYHPFYVNGFQNEIDYFKNYDFDEYYAPLPEELKDVNKSDVYQFNLKNLATFLYGSHASLFGYSVEYDSDSAIGRVAKITTENVRGLDRRAKLYVTSCNAEVKKPIHMYISKDEKLVDDINIFKEDIKHDGYHLYKIGSVSGINTSGETMVYLFSHDYIWFGLLGIAQVMPMDACDVYICAKFTGARYGGNESEDDAIYIERLIVVRK